MNKVDQLLYLDYMLLKYPRRPESNPPRTVFNHPSDFLIDWGESIWYTLEDNEMYSLLAHKTDGMSNKEKLEFFKNYFRSPVWDCVVFWSSLCDPKYDNYWDMPYFWLAEHSRLVKQLSNEDIYELAIAQQKESHGTD
jgi:hypothetical protein